MNGFFDSDWYLELSALEILEYSNCLADNCLADNCDGFSLSFCVLENLELKVEREFEILLLFLFAFPVSSDDGERRQSDPMTLFESSISADKSSFCSSSSSSLENSWSDPRLFGPIKLLLMNALRLGFDCSDIFEKR